MAGSEHAVHQPDWWSHPALPGLLLGLAALLALIGANSPLSAEIEALLGIRLALEIGNFALAKPLLLWVNDGLMALFFFVVGLELKREVVEGSLSSPRRAAVPVAAALGGMIGPAAIYLLIAGGDPAFRPGWAIPCATDIAFALGLLSLLGRRVPTALRSFLLALAVADDLGAILIIAVFYTRELAWPALALAGGLYAVLLVLRAARIWHGGLWLLLALPFWAAILKSGVHATLAGVLIAATVPLIHATGRGAGHRVADRLEHGFQPYVSFVILPLFAFANAGVPLGGTGLALFTHPVTLGVALGLLIGKQIGIVGIAWLTARLSGVPLPARLGGLWGLSLLAGVGFTMSLFIGMLAFDDPDLAAPVRIGVFGGSLLAGVAGLLVLGRVYPKAR